MKRSLMTVVLFASIVPSPLKAQGAANVEAEICRASVKQGASSVGDCLSIGVLETISSPRFFRPPAYGVQFCQEFEAGDPETFYLIFDSFSDCVESHSDS